MNTVTPDQFRGVASALRTYYGRRYLMLVLLEAKKSGLLECLLVLDGEVNIARELLRVEPVARLHSNLQLELAILPISKKIWDEALEPEIWEAHWTGKRL
jgi:hypothetical protein